MNTPGLNNTGTSYLLWLTCLFGVSGIHRFYNKKPISGTLWLLTWGFFGIGQFIDLFLMPSMVEEHNLRQRAKLGLLPGGAMLSQPMIQVVVPAGAASAKAPMPQAALELKPDSKSLTQHDMMLKLLKAAQLRNGKLSVTQAVMDTELGFDQVETAMQEMVKMGYVAVENHPESGVVLYDFLEL